VSQQSARRIAGLSGVVAILLVSVAVGGALAAGTILFDQDNPEKSSVEPTIQTASINTDNSMRDKELCSPNFFNAEKYPTLTSKSSKIERTDQKNVYKVTGDFNMAGVTKPVVLNVEFLGSGPDPFNPKGERAGFMATTTINRLDWGIKWNKTLGKGNSLLGDDVKITFPVEAVLKAS
jgi:polyisoprenoid-binding protein YceI